MRYKAAWEARLSWLDAVLLHWANLRANATFSGASSLDLHPPSPMQNLGNGSQVTYSAPVSWWFSSSALLCAILVNQICIRYKVLPKKKMQCGN
uniref:Putative secreted protein n=1 Tax=Ixodes ricinus TaxID=34613 RepID=A0A6B0UCL2_IXORI